MHSIGWLSRYEVHKNKRKQEQEGAPVRARLNKVSSPEEPILI